MSVVSRAGHLVHISTKSVGVQFISTKSFGVLVKARDGSVLEKTGPGPVLRSVFTVFGP